MLDRRGLATPEIAALRHRDAARGPVAVLQRPAAFAPGTRWIARHAGRARRLVRGTRHRPVGELCRGHRPALPGTRRWTIAARGPPAAHRFERAAAWFAGRDTDRWASYVV